MRILSIQSGVPFGDNTSGLDLRNAAILEALREIGALSLLPMRADRADAAPDWLDVYPLQAESRQRLWGTRYITRPLSYAFSVAEKQEMRAVISALKPDFAVVEEVMLRDSLPILKALKVPVVLDMHNIESDLLAQSFRTRTKRFRPDKLLQEVVETQTAKREDKAAAKMANAVWVCSTDEKEQLARRWGIAAHVVPNSLPDMRLLDLPIVAARYETAHLVFAGLMLYGPNERAIETLCAEVAQKLPSEGRLEIVGRMSSPQQEAMIAAAGAVLVKSPDDMLPHLAAAGYSLMPITYGGGTRIKVLEALAAGVVIIATSKAVEGLALESGVHYWRAETPEAMLEQLAAAMAAPEASAQMATQGRIFVQQHFGPDAIAAAVGVGLENLMKA